MRPALSAAVTGASLAVPHLSPAPPSLVVLPALAAPPLALAAAPASAEEAPRAHELLIAAAADAPAPERAPGERRAADAGRRFDGGSIPSAPAAPAGSSVPDADVLFLRGTFSVRRAKWKLFDEDHFGEELDLAQRRPAVDLAGTVFAAKYGKPGTTLYANFSHDGKLWMARVPEKAVKEVRFLITYFPPKLLGRYFAAHTFLRFELKQDAPIELVAEMPDEAELARLAALPPAARLAALPAPRAGLLVRNAALSTEAQWVKGDKTGKYSLQRGRRGAYTAITRLVSLEDRMRDFYRHGNPTAQVELPVKDGDLLLKAGIEQGRRDGLSRLYDTFWSNCTTYAFDLLAAVEGDKDERWGHIRRFLQKRLPTRVKGKLEQFGGIDVGPAHLDPTLGPELLAGYRRALAEANGAPLCAPGMSKDNCANLTAAVKALREQGRLP